jgi:ATP-dependent Clp protease ATP-binding subunit ClpA
MTEIESIVLDSINLAKRLHHEYVTIEHLTAVVMDDGIVRTMCYEVQADAVGLQEALILYLTEDCKELVVDSDVETHPRKTQMLERVFNRALTQALFQGKRGINQLDLMLSILTEEQSAAVLFAAEMGLTRGKVLEWLQDATEEEVNPLAQTKSEQAPGKRRGTSKKTDAMTVLKQFCNDMTELSAEYDDVVGRRQELKDLVQVLARKKKSNAILVGPSGVGKTAIVEGLAKLIVADTVPDIMKLQKVMSLDMAKLVAGTKYRGDFEERMKQLSDALLSVDDVILFIDEIHMIIGAGGGGANGMDAGNILKPLLTNGKLKVIGATTDEEYRKIFEKESAIARRFTKIQIGEPSPAESKEILRNCLLSYEVYHNVEIDPAAADLAVDLAHEYVFNKKLPDKAFDILDLACAHNKIMPESEQRDVITEEEIRNEVSRLTAIPKEHLGVKSTDANPAQMHVRVEEFLRGTVFGQEQAVRRVTDSITVSLAGLKDPGKPIASYLFTGPTGVGKTETAKRLAEAMGMNMVRFDMAEYQEQHTVSKLIGSPPGYVGYGDGKAGDGLLITNLEDNPNCVLLLDEVEKAHPSLMTVLLTLLDEGTITSSTGKRVSAKNAIIIMTSNLGAREGSTKAIGFGEAEFNAKAVNEAVNNFFSPEFRNRLDGVIQFNALKKENMRQIVVKFLKQLETYVAGRHIRINWENSVLEYLETAGYDPKMGARPLGRLINESIKLPLAKHLLTGDPINWVTVGYENHQVTIQTGVNTPKAIADANIDPAPQLATQ